MKKLKEVLKRNGKKLYIAFSAALLVGANFSVAYAENDWGENIKTWVTKQASALAVAAVVIILVPMFFKKMWALMIGTIFLGAIGIYFVNNPDKFTTIGNAIYKIIFGG